ncbi:A24 family peptidase [Mycobacterium sp. CPCC 205372]|uniref:A24 family peptidase n=1 Tax=Mycobacterium hippophais TaxID=3016340 RepID=A0ABT4PSI3_9MYCO|nr:A24 family peptidase [Mycobacterium hippophais]MCZ8379529.1 A24 family peptidase [Mycobacterium hippophais]
MGAGVLVAAACWLVALSICDIRKRRLPNALTLPGAVLVLAAAVLAGRAGPATLGAAALFACYAAVHLVSPAAMGAGDVKLALGVGGLTGAFGPDVWVLAALTAPLLTAGWAVVALLRRRGSTVPHGPAMCAATAAAVTLAVL